MDGKWGRAPISITARSFIPCAWFTRESLPENLLQCQVLGGREMMLPSDHWGQWFCERSGNSWRFLKPFQGLFKVKAIFLAALRCDLPFHSHSLSLYFILTNFSHGQHKKGMGFVETKHFCLFILVFPFIFWFLLNSWCYLIIHFYYRKNWVTCVNLLSRCVTGSVFPRRPLPSMG